jgi:hypothetical protein
VFGKGGATVHPLFHKGEEADRLLLAGEVEAAVTAYRGLIAEARGAEMIDGFILSKCYLGLIIAEAKSGHFDAVQSLVNTQLADESADYVQRIGVFGLQKGMVSRNDYTIFYNLATFAGDATKHEAIIEKLRSITLSEWVPPPGEVTVFSRGVVRKGEREPDGTIRAKRPWWKFW